MEPAPIAAAVDPIPDVPDVPPLSQPKDLDLKDIFPIHNPRILKPYRKRSRQIEDAIHVSQKRLERLGSTMAQRSAALAVAKANWKLEKQTYNNILQQKTIMLKEFQEKVAGILRKNKEELEKICCCICLEDSKTLTAITLRQCGHGFHVDCILEYFYAETFKHDCHTIHLPALPENPLCPMCKFPFNIKTDLCPIIKCYKEVKEKRLKIQDSLGYQVFVKEAEGIQFDYKMYSLEEEKDMRSFASVINYPYIRKCFPTDCDAGKGGYYPCSIVSLAVEVAGGEIHSVATRDHNDLVEAWEHHIDALEDQSPQRHRNLQRFCTYIDLVCYSQVSVTNPRLRVTSDKSMIEDMLDSFVIT